MTRPENRRWQLGLGLMAAAAGGWWAASAALRSRRRVSASEKVVVITGGARGLGLELAREFGRRGARLAICSRTESQLDAAADELRGRGYEVFAERCDVRDPAAVHEFLLRVERSLGPVDVLVNNAGIIQVGPLETQTSADFHDSITTHLEGPRAAIEAVLPTMRRRRFGRIVNIASFGGEVAVPHLPAYCTGKFALVGYSRSLRIALARHGILVTTVCPGLMRTGSARNASFKGKHRAEYGWFSIGAAMPLVTVSSASAARRIVDACLDGVAELTFPLQMSILTRLAHLFPELTIEIESLLERAFPSPGGIGKDVRPGRESESMWSPSVLTTLGDQAARRNNEFES